MSRGYHRRPDQTAGVFLPDPWSAEPGARLYKTGDLARFLPHGALGFLGRVDDQLKVRGFRIEPGEIDAVLGQHSYIRESAVVVQEPAPGDRRLVAFVVPEPGEVVLEGDLRSFIRQKLPPFMVPSAIVPLEALPRTPNGKVDRRALLAMPAAETGKAASRRSGGKAARGGGEPAFAAPRSAVERRLVAIWEEVLNVRPIGIDESFFDLGGHSLLAVRLMARIESEIGERPPLAALFRGGTIASLAAGLGHREAAFARPGAVVRPPLVALAEARTAGRPPLYLVHPIGGTVLCYGALARRLGTERSVYALEAPGLQDGDAPMDTVESLAAHYLKTMREHSPAGPYLLGGWSFGGVVAYEIARRLAALGERVPVLALIDSRAPGSAPAPANPVDGVTLVAMLARELGGGSEPLDRTMTEGDLDRVIERARARGLLPSSVGPGEIRRLLEVLRANLAALRTYLPGPYPGRVTLFRAAEAAAGHPDPALGWRALAAGGVEVDEVPGDHDTMVREPQVRVLAQRLGERLEEAGEAGRRPPARRQMSDEVRSD